MRTQKVKKLYGVELKLKHLQHGKRKQLMNIKNKQEKQLTIKENLLKTTENI